MSVPTLSLAVLETESFAVQMQEFIPDDATVVTVKWNCDADYDVSLNRGHYSYFTAVNYLKDCGVTILASSSGMHLQGENGVPHLHYHFICERFNAPCNPSQHRQRWCNKNDMDFSDCTFKYQKLKPNTPKYAILSYPYKEGHVCARHEMHTYNNMQMTLPMREFLRQVGESIYQSALALKLRQNLLSARRQLALSELYELVKSESFSSFREMQIWLDSNYIASLQLQDYPDPKHYKTNTQKVAVKLGLLKYSDL